MIRRRRKHFHEHVEEDLEILPLMNLFVVLIPMLLISAVFIEMAVIRMDLPGDHDPPAKPRESLALSVSIQPESWVVKGRRLEARTIDRDGEDAETRLAETLAAIAADHPDDHEVVIRSQPETHYDDIVAVMDVSRGAGLPNVSLAEDRP
jgi:biopolymer transport protein ExbD